MNYDNEDDDDANDKHYNVGDVYNSDNDAYNADRDEMKIM